MSIISTDHIDLHFPGSVKTITMCTNNQDVSYRFIIFAEHWPTPPSWSGAQVDNIEPEEDEVKMSQFWFLIFWMILTQSPDRDNCGTVQLLSQVKHHQCHSSGVCQEHLVSSIQVLMTSIVPNIYQNIPLITSNIYISFLCFTYL